MRRMVRPAYEVPNAFSVSQTSAGPGNSQGPSNPRRLHRRHGAPFSRNGPCRALSPDEIKALNIKRKMDELRAAWLGGKSMPSGYWELRDNRVAAIKVLVEIVTKIEERPIESIDHDDFAKCHLGWLLRNYYHSWSEALEDAGFKIECPWLGRRVPSGYWKVKENRVKATKWLVARCKKETSSIGEIQYTDFTGNKLHGLLDYYNSSPFAALLEADLVTKEQRSSFTSEKRMQNLKLAYGSLLNAEQSRSLPGSERSPAQQDAQLVS